MKGKSPILISLSACLLLGASSTIFLNFGNDEFDALSSWSYGDVTFGASEFTDGTAVTTSSFSTKNIEVSSIEASKCYGASSSSTSALRIGSSSSTGSITFNFSSSYSITAIRVLPYKYDKDCGLSITDNSMYSVSQDVSATEGTDISDCLASSWLSYTGFSGSISSLTFAGVTNRVNLCKFVVVLDGASSYNSSALSSSGYVSSYSSSSKASSSTSFDSVSYSYANTSNSWSSLTNTSYSNNYIDATAGVTYRLSPKSVSGDNATCYKVTQNGGTYYKTAVETITKGGVYTDPNEVALYYNAFASFPANYSHYTSSNLSSVKSSAYASFGNKARLYTEYSKTSGYTTIMPTLNYPTGFNYIEADIASTSAYASGASWNRGSARLVIFPSGTTKDNDGAFSVKTLDHYGHFREFSNSVEGWGDNFDGVDSSNNAVNDSNGAYSSIHELTTINPAILS